MFVLPLLVGVLTSSHATDPTSIIEDEESLLQTKAQAHPLHSQTEVNPSVLLESVQGMAKQLKHGARVGSPESMTAAIASVNTALATLEPELEDEHAHAQQQIQSQVAEIQACHSSEAHGTLVTDALADDLSIMSQCIADQTEAAATEDRECSEWTNHATGLAFPLTNLHNESPETAYEVALSLKDWVDGNWAIIESQRRECNEASTFAANKASECSPVIADYDDRFCQHTLACNLQSACHAHEVEVYNVLSDDARIAMSARLARYSTIQHVRCVMDLVVNALNTNTTIDDSSLDSCDGDDVTGNVDHLTLDFPSPQTEPQCQAPQHDDPQCPEVDLPLAWTGAAAPGPLSASLSNPHFDCWGSGSCLSAVPLEVGLRPWSDRNYEMISFIDELAGATVFKVPMENMYHSRRQELTLQVDSPAMVYLVATADTDDWMCGWPDIFNGRDGWEDIGRCMNIESHNNRALCWKSQIDAGETTIPIGNQYCVGLILVRPV